MSFIEEQAEVGEDHPELLPAIAVLELSQQISRELILSTEKAKALCPHHNIAWQLSSAP